MDAMKVCKACVGYIGLFALAVLPYPLFLVNWRIEYLWVLLFLNLIIIFCAIYLLTKAKSRLMRSDISFLSVTAWIWAIFDNWLEILTLILIFISLLTLNFHFLKRQKFSKSELIILIISGTIGNILLYFLIFYIETLILHSSFALSSWSFLIVWTTTSFAYFIALVLYTGINLMVGLQILKSSIVNR